MCDPTGIAIGIAIGAATGAAGAAITGNDVGQGALMGGIMGGATGGFFPGSVGVGTAFPFAPGALTASMGTTVLSTSGMLGAFAVGLAGSVAKGLLLPDPPSYEGYTPISQVTQYNSQNIATTGSGGRQATASLADAIKRSKKRKLTQEDVGDLSIDTGSFANTGLQLA
tara:strand:+ start:90 stop:596 length:507 start_codon:yes stop_codon:yes gene_type:complete